MIILLRNTRIVKYNLLMARHLLNSLTKKFHRGVKKDAGMELGFKQSALQHFIGGRPVKDFVIVLIRRLYGKKYNNNGYSDSQILDLLEKDYDEKELERLMGRYK